MKKRQSKKSPRGRVKKSLAIIGCGNLGSAVLRGVLNQEVFDAAEIVVCETSDESRALVAEEFGVEVTDSASDAASSASVVLLAVKPKDMIRALQSLGNVSGKVLISVAVGFTGEMIQRALGRQRPSLVRVVPNVAAAIGLSMSAVFSEDDGAAETAIKLFDSVGLSVRIQREADLNTASALAASGPVFFFTAIEGMIDGAVRMGMAADTARLLLAQTALGAGALLLESDLSPAELRAMVTTPGGTTIEGVSALEERAVRAAFQEAVTRTTEKARAIEARLSQ